MRITIYSYCALARGLVLGACLFGPALAQRADAQHRAEPSSRARYQLNSLRQDSEAAEAEPDEPRQDQAPHEEELLAIPPPPEPTEAIGAGLDPAAAASTYTLAELVQIAEQLSPNVREAQFQVQAARGRAYQAGLYPNPQLFTASPQWAGSISQYNMFVGQEVVTKGKLRMDRAALARAAQQAELKYRRTRYDVLTLVRQGFYNSLIAQRRVEVLQNLVQIAEKSKAAAESLLKAGEGTRTDAILLEIELDRASVALENAETQLVAARRQLAASVGDPFLPIGRLQGDLTATLPDFEQEALQRGVISQNAYALIAQTEITRTQILLDRARVEPHPNLNLQGGFQYAVESPYHAQGYAQFMMAVPIWNRNQGGIRAASGAVRAAVAGAQRVQNELASQAALALGNFTAARQLVERYEQRILPKARETLRITQQAYAQGQFDFLRLLQAQRTLVEADLGYVNAQQARWTAAAEIASLLQVDEFP